MELENKVNKTDKGKKSLKRKLVELVGAGVLVGASLGLFPGCKPPEEELVRVRENPKLIYDVEDRDLKYYYKDLTDWYNQDCSLMKAKVHQLDIDLYSRVEEKKGILDVIIFKSMTLGTGPVNTDRENIEKYGDLINKVEEFRDIVSNNLNPVYEPFSIKKMSKEDYNERRETIKRAEELYNEITKSKKYQKLMKKSPSQQRSVLEGFSPW